ncbi:MAG TPA: phosphoribosylformylglycinamidine cyclo-ligase [Bryobacteraceae bacterium]|nr:phosphoribosylformylglycinamidine cyclo-ligase [Bryobacteraceae bacterium]
MTRKKSLGYKDAGVNIDEANAAVARIRKMARSTFTPAVLTDIGSFGGGFRLQGFRDPVLVSSADGVGTKIKLAFSTGRHSTIGEDLVNHCVNDIAVQGATPLFFLDYFATGKLDAKVTADVVSGIARGCKANGCALIGGETAEMPGMYAPGEYDLAGFIVGVVEQKRMITGASIREGDVLIGLPSTGLHTNGYSLARKLIPKADEQTIDELLKLHRSYLKPLRKLHDAGILKGAAHITGGGITENTPRILPKGLGARIDRGSWPVLPIFELLRKLGDIPEDDWRRTFNLGIGMIVVISPKDEPKLKMLREPWYRIGEVIRGRGVQYY